MDLRDTILKVFGPGYLGGVGFGLWMRLLWDNGFAISPRFLGRALSLTNQSFQNSLMVWRDRWIVRGKLDSVEVPPPVFILGHWRSGTTHLHNLLALDDRFAYSNNYQVLFPHTFLASEAKHARIIDRFMPKQRPMDNVEWSMSTPQEDEFALCNLSGMSPYTGCVFQRRREYYDRYLTLRDVTSDELAKWKAAFQFFLRKLTWKYRKPLILKSPPHTCRIKLLLELYPQARFIHIHRHPYAVFQSSRHLFLVNHPFHSVQRPRLEDLDGWILDQYARMHTAFFEERGLIPPGQFHELAFEDLERDPIEQVKQIYQVVHMPDYAHVEEPLRAYVATLAGYKKNDFSKLSAELKQKIAAACSRSFEEWGYST